MIGAATVRMIPDLFEIALPKGVSWRRWMRLRSPAPRFDIVGFWVTLIPDLPWLAHRVVLRLLSILIATARLEGAFSSVSYAMGDRRGKMEDASHSAVVAYAINGDKARRFDRAAPVPKL